MAIFDLFSKRQKRLRGEILDVYQYEKLSTPLKAQIIHIIADMAGKSRKLSTYGGYRDNPIYEKVHEILCREYGLFCLMPDKKSNAEQVIYFFLSCKEIENCLDVIEIFFKLANQRFIEKKGYDFHKNYEICQTANSAINELNTRFKEHGFGYEFSKESDQLIRIDSQFIHSEVVKPVLLLLQSDSYFQGANEEFIKAHEHYRHQHYDAAIVEAAKAFESCLKGICDKHKWTYDPQKDTASKLIAVCLKNNLVPPYLEEQLTHLRCLLESGIPTVRNKSAGHGQGSQPKAVPQELASYALHLTATNLLFLGECEKKVK